MEKQKVLLAMSGGVDSSVAGLLLKKSGYDVVGVFMKNWSDTKDPLTGKCAWRSEKKMAIKIASKLDIPLFTIDSEKQYKNQVIEKMFEQYKKGITPNPDIECNQKIKFPMLLKYAKKLKINLIATGHYSRVQKNTKGKYELLRGIDETKDQSYFLYKINQNELKHLLLPIGNYTKTQIREIARKNNLPNYDKKGTTGICFIGKINFKEFLRKKIKQKKGKILDPEGNIIGEHDGVFYYTIGERLGPRYGFEIQRDSLQKKDNERKNILDFSLVGNSNKKEGRVFGDSRILVGNWKSKKNNAGNSMQFGESKNFEQNKNIQPNEKFSRWYVAKKKY